MAGFSLGGWPIGEGEAPLVLPDIGTFFNQDLEEARRLIEAVKAAGARVIKGEILHTADICMRSGAMEKYLSPDGEVRSEGYRELIERKVVGLDDYRRLFSLCHRAGLPFVLSVYDMEGTDFAKSIGACGLKIASANIVHAPLIRHAASTGLPLLIDTGKSTWEEIERALRWAREAGAMNVVIEHSPDAPPAPLENHNLRFLHTLRDGLGAPVGLSDHHEGEEMLYAAAALGASILEKGVCLRKDAADQDVFHALPVGMLGEVIRKCGNIHRALGDGARRTSPVRPRPTGRMGLVALTNLPAGAVLGPDNVAFRFPTLGIPVEDWDAVSGGRLRRAKRRDEPLDHDDVELL
jgi:sialic acid synthase SpsE